MAEIETMIANAKSYANEAISQAVSYVEKYAAIEDLVNELVFVDQIPLQAYSQIIDMARELKNIVDRAKPDKPSALGSFTIPATPDIDEIDINELKQTIAEMIQEIESIPETIAKAIITYDTVNTKLIKDLTEGSYGIDPADETALWERARDRETEAMDIEINEAKDLYATYGIPIPQGALNKLIEKIVNKAELAMSNFNKEISIKRADLYRTTREFTIDKSIEFVKTGFGLTESKLKMLSEAVRADVETVKLELDHYKTLLQKYGYDFDGIIKEQDILSDIYKADISSFAARMGAIGHAYSVLQAASADQLGADRLLVSESMNRAKTQIEAFNLETEIKISEMREVTNVLAHKVSGALASLNTLVAQIETTEKE